MIKMWMALALLAVGCDSAEPLPGAHDEVDCDPGWGVLVERCERACVVEPPAVGGNCIVEVNGSAGGCSQTTTFDGVTGCCALTEEAQGAFVARFFECL
jgi:hypothetical protein